MGTTKMTPPERTSNGKTEEVKTELSDSTVLTDEQKAVLAEVAENGGKEKVAARKTTVKKATATKVEKPKQEKPASTRLRATQEGDPEGSRRCTHPDHPGERFFASGKDAGFYIKPDGTFGGAWCGDCKRRVSKEKRDERKAAEVAATPETPTEEPQVPVTE